MSTRWPNIVVWTLAVCSALLWTYALTRPSNRPAPAPTSLRAANLPMDLTRLLGADATPTPVAGVAPPVADARMQLIGVVSASSEEDAEEGLALIAMNGQPAKVYRVGMVVDGDTVLQSVEARGAKLGPLGGATLIALSATPLGTLAAPERQRSTATMAAAMPLPATPPSLPPPTPLPTPSADGTPPPFGGPPQAFGGAPPAQPQGLPRRSGTRQPLRD